jgi:type II restriction enzyme
MKFDDLAKIYEDFKNRYGIEAYKYISEIFKIAKEIHIKQWEKSPTPGKDHEQSWKAFKGKNLEKLIIYIIREEVERLGLKIVKGDVLERKDPKKLSEELSKVKRAVSINYGIYGLHLPDADVIIYDPKTIKIICILSSKSTLRERIAETGYWKIKLSQDPVTKDIKFFFVTLDEDGDLLRKFPTKKGRAIAEVDTDGSYVMSEERVEESDKVKTFDKFIKDLEVIVKKAKRESFNKY